MRPGFVRAARDSLERIAAETRDIVALVGVPLLDGHLYNACAICARREVAGWAKKWHLPNYGVFDEKRYFASGDELAIVEVAGTKVGITICEDMWVPGATDDRARRGRRRARRQSLGVPVPRRTRAGTRGHLLGPRARERRSRRALQHGRRSGRAHLRRALARSSTATAACWRGRPASRRRCSSSTSSGRRRLRLAALDDDLEQMRQRARPRPARLRREERLRRRRRQRLGRDRLGRHGRARRRGARLRARPLRLDAVPLLVRGDASRRAPARREPRLRLPRAADRAGRRGVHRRPRAVVRRARSGCRGGEPPGADPRNARDGALQQVRLAARGERQQVGAVGRLRDALRGHGRRIRPPQGRVQDRRLPTRAAPERAGRARARPAVDDRPSAERGAARGSAATRTRCRRTPSWITCSRPTSRTTARSTS